MTKSVRVEPEAYRGAIICDFDATITTDDVCDALMKAFSDDRWRNIGKRYLKGELSHQELNEKFVSFLDATPGQIDKFISLNISVRPGFNSFVEYCYANDYALFIVSSGWDYYIKKILAKFEKIQLLSVDNLSKIRGRRLFIICNKIRYLEDTRGWKIKSPSFPISFQSVPDKKFILISLKGLKYSPIVVIGDSMNDLKVALTADKVFARGELADLCERNGIHYKRFETFYDVIKGLNT